MSENNRSLSICLTGYRSEPFSGGQGIYLKFLSKALVDAGHKVDVISGQPYPDLDERVRLIKLPGLNLFEEGLGSFRLKNLFSITDIIEWLGKLTGGFSEPYCFSRRLYKHLKNKKNKYDIIHDNQCLGWGILKLQRKGFPVITTIHHPITSDRDIAILNTDTFLMRIFIRRWYSFLKMQMTVASKLKYILTVSKKSCEDLEKDFHLDKKNIHIIYNGIDTNLFRPIFYKNKDPYKVIVTASSDQPVKGLKYLLLAFKKLTPKYPKLNLLVVGKLQSGGEIESLIFKLDLEKKITFIHGISSESLVEHYALSSIAVVPSIYEGFGLPAAEAMACGIPVISTNGGALPEIVGEAGLIVPVKNSELIAYEIEKLIEDKSLREDLGLAGRKRIEENFSWDVTAEKVAQLYKSII
tara:strand:- start:1535 stop:2767 length:1233 start_codon:yes stop_codon:yes gene_type:complete